MSERTEMPQTTYAARPWCTRARAFGQAARLSQRVPFRAVSIPPHFTPSRGICQLDSMVVCQKNRSHIQARPASQAYKVARMFP